MAKSVADQFVETLAAAGVKRIYGIVGDSLNGLTDALRRQGKIEWIHVRHEVAKQTGAHDQSRYIPLEPAAAQWLRLIPIRTDRIMEISQSTLQRLNHELLHKLKIQVPENGLRNGYASWAATFRPAGELASAMGDLESTVKRYYITRREPGSGRAWFDIRPQVGARKIVPITREVA